jgi:hypothetical protein
MAADTSLLSPPNLAGGAETALYTRATAEYEAAVRQQLPAPSGASFTVASRRRQDERFSLKGKVYGQYCNLYFNRLASVRERMKSEAERLWPSVPGERAASKQRSAAATSPRAVQLTCSAAQFARCWSYKRARSAFCLELCTKT